MKTRIVYIFLFICAMNLNLYSQDYHKLIDTAYIKAVYAKFDSFVESIDSLREKKECLNVYVVYYSHLKDNDIEEFKISPKYYLSGEFLEDLQELQILQRNFLSFRHKQAYGVSRALFTANVLGICREKRRFLCH